MLREIKKRKRCSQMSQTNSANFYPKQMILNNFEQAAKLLSEKLLVLWPASKNTPPTESNIVTACVQAFSSQEYHVFTEIPFGKGRFDFLAYHKELNFLVIGEMKSDKENFTQEITNDYKRMLEFQLSDFPIKPINMNPEKIYTFIGYWTEVPNKIAVLKDTCQNKTPNHALSSLISDCDETRYYSLVKDAKEGEDLHLFFFLKEK